MDIPVLCEDTAHPASLTMDALRGVAGFQLDFECVTDPEQCTSERLARHTLLVFAKANQRSAQDREPWTTTQNTAPFVDYVARGGSILFLHSGTALYRDVEDLRRLMGGVFVSHPPQCDVTVEPVEGHNLTAGSQPFTVFDEHYLMEMVDDDVDIFLHSHSLHGIEPAGWTRRRGAGRTAVLTPGHNPDVWSQPDYARILHNTLTWCLETT